MRECASSCRDDVEICCGRDEYLDGDLAAESKSRGCLPWQKLRLKYFYSVAWSLGCSLLCDKIMLHFASPSGYEICFPLLKRDFPILVLTAERQPDSLSVRFEVSVIHLSYVYPLKFCLSFSRHKQTEVQAGVNPLRSNILCISNQAER
jgi:hypothetical protein